jgi:hypothetical protein
MSEVLPDDTELAQMRDALMDWLESRSIPVGVGCVVFGHIIAATIVAGHRTKEGMRRSVRLYANALENTCNDMMGR